MSIPTSKLKYSDYFQGVAIASGTVASSAFLAGFSTPTIPSGTVTGVFALVATVAGVLSQWLQSKGD